MFTDIIPKVLKDVESAQHTFRSWLNQHEAQFQQEKKLHPGIKRLRKVHADLRVMIKGRKHIVTALKEKKPIIEIDLLRGVFKREDLGKNELGRAKIELVLSFGEWAMPYVTAALDVGFSLQDDIERNLDINWVGMVPRYTRQGFLLIPSPTAKDPDRILVFFYKKIPEREEGRYCIKTSHVRAVSATDPMIAKEKMLENRSVSQKVWNPDPATVFVDAPNYPLNDTVLPVAENALLHFLSLGDIFINSPNVSHFSY